VADADAAVAAADEQVRAAERAVREAERTRDDFDAAAAGIWSDFTHRYGAHRVERLGRTVPEPAVPHQRDRSAAEYLDDARALARLSPPAARGGGLRTVFALLGVLGALAGVAAHAALTWAGRRAGGEWATAMPVIGLIVMVLGPVLALIGGHRIADRRGAVLDAATVGTGLVAGLLTAGLLYAGLPGR
jgi:hypothetical protein